MNHINKIKDLEKKLKDEISKNQRLENENKELKEKVDKITQEKVNEINIIKMQLDIYKKENQKLNDDLSKTNKTISSMYTKNNEIIDLKNEIINLKEKLISKDNEINQLKLKHNNDEPKCNQNEIMILNFISTEVPTIQNCGIACFPNEIFAEVEEKVYKRFNEYRNSNNVCIAGGMPILRFKKLSENNLKNGDIVQIIINDIN